MKSFDIFAYTTAINTIAAVIAEDLTDDQLALYAAVFTQIGDVLATIAVLRVTEGGLGGNNGEKE